MSDTRLCPSLYSLLDRINVPEKIGQTLEPGVLEATSLPLKSPSWSRVIPPSGVTNFPAAILRSATDPYDVGRLLAERSMMIALSLMYRVRFHRSRRHAILTVIVRGSWILGLRGGVPPSRARYVVADRVAGLPRQWWRCVDQRGGRTSCHRASIHRATVHT